MTVKRTIEECVGTSAAWTPERRAKQATAIRDWQPWAKSTGPRTAEGKTRSSRNADKGIAEFEAKLLEARLTVRASFLEEAEKTLSRFSFAGETNAPLE